MQRTDFELRALWPACDEECRPHYLLVATAGEGEVEQRRFVRLDEAIDQLRALGVEPVPARAA